MRQPGLTVEKKKDYRLVRVAVCGGEDCWFGQSLTDMAGKAPDAAKKNAVKSDAAKADAIKADAAERDGGKPGDAVRIWRWLWRVAGRQRRRRKQEKRRQQEEQQEEQQRRQQAEERSRLVRRQLAELAEAILAQTGELDTCACVYAGGADRLLKGNGRLARLWESVWDMQEFADYRTLRWAGCLLPYVTHCRFVVLGTASCAPEIIKGCARRMKSLRWIVRERDCDEGLQEFVEEFYEDYGLAATLQTVEGRNGFRTLCMETTEPVCVLDFTEEVKFFWGGLEQDSVWLDFASLEEKEKRMRCLAPGIRYYSLKKLWSSGE